MGSYFGSKATSGLCQPLIAMMPPHDTYIETHLGGGAIMKRKPAARMNIGIDIDPRALAKFECGYPVQRNNTCAHHYLAAYDYQGRELIYCDPPYLKRTRTSGRKYRFDYEERDHIELLVGDENEKLAEIVFRGESDPDSLSPVEFEKFILFTAWRMGAWEMTFLHYEEGLIAERNWKVFDAWYSNLLARGPGYRRWWEAARHGYDSAFQDHVDRVFGAIP